ncbi:MAG: hypothetical protein IMF01_09590 [Proteobacteria bacterium]|nr:hypothetical protein [Pseudomonadota bacterium]
MTIQINFLHNLDAIEGFYSNLMQDVAGPAVKAAINKALITGRTETLKEIHNRISLNTRVKAKKSFSKDNVKIFKATGTNAFNTSGAMAFTASALPMLYFVRGNISNIKQKGVKVSKRKKLKVQIYKGKKFTLKKAFIQKHKSKQVFKRGDGRSMIKQGIPSMSEMVDKSRLKMTIRKLLQKRFGIELKRQMKWRLDKAAKRANGISMKKHR